MQLTVASKRAKRPGERRLPPGPPHPAALQTLGGRLWPYAYLECCQRACGDRFTVRPFNMEPLVFLADPGDVRAVLTADPGALHPGAGASMIAPVVGERSFMLCEEGEHLHGRRTVAPAFHRRLVAGHAAALARAVERAVRSWPLDEPVALHPRIRALTLAAILGVIFSGRESGALQPLHRLLMHTLNVTDGLLLHEPRLRRVPGWRKTWRRFLARRRQIDGLLDRLIAQRRASGPGGGDLLDLLLQARDPDGGPMSEGRIRDNLMSTILASHETTAGELTWAFQLLAHNPAAQGRLREELAGGANGGREYLAATIHETLRHRPVFAFAIPRRVARATEIGGWTYRPPAQLAACTYLMHHCPDLYPDPHAFRPERFLGTRAPSRTWLPWGGGRKVCLGRHFALLQVETVIRQVVSTRMVLPAARAPEGPRWRSAIVVPRAGGRVILRRLGS